MVTLTAQSNDDLPSSLNGVGPLVPSANVSGTVSGFKNAGA